MARTSLLKPAQHLPDARRLPASFFRWASAAALVGASPGVIMKSQTTRPYDR